MGKKSKSEDPERPENRLYEFLERRRKYPRVVIDVPAAIIKDSNDVIAATVHDISIDGIQIRCDRETARTLHPSGKYIQDDQGPIVEIEFDLPFREKAGPVRIKSQIYYLAVVSKKEFAFGLMFRNYLGKSAELVDRFIMEQIIPMEDKVRNFLGEPRSPVEISEHMNMKVNEVDEVINRLQVKGEIITFADEFNVKHLKLSSAIASILSKLDEMEKRLARVEKTAGKK